MRHPYISPTRRAGFHFLDLLATLFVLSLLASLLLPALQAARENARLNSCKNNLKQIGLALHNYHDTYITLPPGWITKTDLPNSDSGIGWQTSILPFVEEGMLYDQIGNNRIFHEKLPDINTHPVSPNSIEEALQTTIPTYICVNDRTPVINTSRGNYGLSNYSGNYGSNPLNPLGSSDAAQNWPGIMKTHHSQANGIFAWNSKTRFDDITDGTSNTLFFGERAVQNAAGIWPGVRSNAQANDAVSDCAFGNEFNTTLASFSSQHLGGMNVAFVDGSVRLMNENIDSQPDIVIPGQPPTLQGVYQKFASRNDRQVFVGDVYFSNAQ